MPFVSSHRVFFQHLRAVFGNLFPHLLRRVLFLGGCAWITAAVTECRAWESRSDDRSLSALFGESASPDPLEARRLTRTMPPEQRYEYLLAQVLPAHSDRIRQTVDYLPTNPSPPVVEKYGSATSPLLTTESRNRIPSGGILVSPAIDLVEAAEQLGKLDQLKAEVSRRSSAETEQVKARVALLILIAAAEGNPDQFGGLLTEFTTLVRESPVVDPERAPEMIVVWQGMQAAETRSELFDLLTFLRIQILFGENQHRERIKRHVVSLHHLLDEQFARENSASPDRFTEQPLKHWHVASRDKAESRGDGYPNAMWTTAPGRVRRVSNHDFDYLYYSIPLRGDFEIEGDLNTFGYRGTRLAVGTVWMGPSGRQTVYRGTFRGWQPPLKVDPPFSKFGEEMRVRDVVRGGIRTTSINGREILTRSQGPLNEPWIAAMSHWKNCGEVRNLRITGNPEIPDEIDLIADPDLPGWLPYFVSLTIGGWRLQLPPPPSLIERLNPFRDEPSAVLVSRKDRSFTGRYKERLLRYHRPMVEDGTIEYEFFYQPGEYAVCPALDRCCFLFDAERAGIHWLTDGKFDRTGLDPANFTTAGKIEQIPLKPDDWNRVQLTLKGDEARVLLNGKSIFARTLEPENLRTFGLFYYADQTGVMVRKLRWRGEWPKKLPPPREQELADFTVDDELARGPELQAVFEHDFSKGLPLDRIWVAGRDWQELTEQRPHGLWMRRPGGSHDLYEKNTLSLPFGLQGDFEVTWEFDDFQSEIAENGNGNVHILMLFDDGDSTECRHFRLFRKKGFPDKGDHEQLVQTAVFYTPSDGRKRFTHPASVAEHSTGGKLRIVRRGTTLYFLSAETDSNDFRLVYQSDITAAPVKIGGIKGIIETHQEGETRAIWKRVTVRAESVPAVLESRRLTLEQLDRQRSQLAKSLSVDFNRETDPKLIAVGGDPTRVSRENDGWLIRQPGFDQWQGTEIKPEVTLGGDFDIALEMDVLKLEQSQTGSKSTVYLHAGFDTPRPLGVEIKYSKAAGSPRSLEIRATTSARDGELRYDELKHMKADRVTQLRIARRGPIAYLIARQSPEDEPEIIGRIEVGTADISPNSLRALVHTGGAGQETIVRYTSMAIHAEQILSPVSQ